MALLNVFKKIAGGFKAFGKGAAKVAEVAGDVAEHPGMAVLSAAFPVAWLTVGLRVVRSVNEIADDFKKDQGRPMEDEQKRAAFEREFKAEFPEASRGDIVTLAGLLVKLEKSGEGEDVCDQPPS